MTLTPQESQIVRQILRTVFDCDADVCGIQIHDETVVIVTSYALYSLGKDYFRELVLAYKSEVQAPVAVKPVVSRRALSVTKNREFGANSIWQVIGETGNKYEVHHNSHSGSTRCQCKAAKFGRQCYHADAVVREAVGASLFTPSLRYKSPAARGIPPMQINCKSNAEIAAENERIANRGVKLLPDGTVEIDKEFYRLMGGVSQVRGASMRELRRRG
jgi:hypothetical protein